MKAKGFFAIFGILFLSASVALGATFCCCAANFIKKALTHKSSCCDASQKDASKVDHNCNDCSIQAKAENPSTSFDIVTSIVKLLDTPSFIAVYPDNIHLVRNVYHRGPPGLVSQQPLYIQFHSLRL